MKLIFLLPIAMAATAMADEGVLAIPVGGKPLVSYQAKPLAHPFGGEKFKGSNFIHPLKTPSGFTVTDSQPGDHRHHFGLWWPWKFVGTGDRKVLCWELQKGDGIIKARESGLTEDGFTARSVYIDRQAPGGPRVLINETLTGGISKPVRQPAHGYFLDLEIVHEVAGAKSLEILKYRYSGFSIRGSSEWDVDNSTVLTSEGIDYSKSNSTRARWVRIEGAAGNGRTAGVLIMSGPHNHDHPEKLRTWSPGFYNGAIFVNFNPVQEKSWTFEPGKKYTRNYRLFIYDGKVTSDQAGELWKTYEKEQS